MMGLTAQNMPNSTNSLLSPTTSPHHCMRFPDRYCWDSKMYLNVFMSFPIKELDSTKCAGGGGGLHLNTKRFHSTVTSEQNFDFTFPVWRKLGSLRYLPPKQQRICKARNSGNVRFQSPRYLWVADTMAANTGGNSGKESTCSSIYLTHDFKCKCWKHRSSGSRL